MLDSFFTWGMSAAILFVGLLNLPHRISKHAAVVLLIFCAFVNFVDNFPGNQTVFRQYAFLAGSVSVVMYSLYQRQRLVKSISESRKDGQK